MREYLVFSNLPYDFEIDLPIELGGGVLLDRSDRIFTLIARADDRERQRLGALIAPEYLAGTGWVHVCLSRAHTKGGRVRARSDIFWALTALRLALPCPMRISSIVTLTDDGTVPGDGIGVLHFDAMCPADGPKCLAAFDIERAKRVHTRLRQLRGAALGRMRSAIYYFDHISTGGVRSWQLAMLGGIACLEALFPQPQPGKKNGKKAWSDGLKYEERLANRVSSFLPRHLVWRSIREWLERVYKSHRNELAHGLHIVPFSGRSSKKRQRDQQRVLELARLCILGMLGKSNREISQLLPRDAREEAVQKALNDIGAAPAEFLRSQRRWA